jgi:hypothetical protein
LDLPILGYLLFPDLGIRNQSIFHSSETRLYRQQIVVQGLLLLRTSQQQRLRRFLPP